MIADGNSSELQDYFEAFAVNSKNDNQNFWNLKYQLDEINKVLKIDK